MTSKLLAVAKWNQVFETSESRKYQKLRWIALPISFLSTGFQTMLDDFGDEAPAFYGAWCALVSVAAQANIRGVLVNNKGKALKTSHIARLTGFPATLFDRLIEWAASEEVRWLVEYDPDSYQLNGDPDSPGFCGDSDSPEGSSGAPGRLPGDSPSYQTKPNQTKHNITQPNHQSDGDGLEDEIFSLDWDKETAQSMAERFRRNAGSISKTRLKSSLIGQVLIVAEAIGDPSLTSDLAARFREGEVRKPEKYIQTAVANAVKRYGVSGDEAMEMAGRKWNQIGWSK